MPFRSDDTIPPECTSRTDTTFLKFHTRATGFMAALGIAVLLFAAYMPQRAGVLVGGLAILVVVGCGAQFVFQGATLISLRLECPDPEWYRHRGHPRVRYEVIPARRPRRARRGCGRGLGSPDGAARDCTTA
jgi:hypothetical protein